MTAKEALEYFKRRKELTGLSDRVQQAEDLAIEALEKQIPEKPKKIYGKVNLKWCECGNYLGELKNEQNYCKRCGQALDWSETE